MKNLDTAIQELLGKQLGDEGIDVVDLVPIPRQGDRLVRIRTLQEALEDFDGQNCDQVASYLVQVRRKQAQAAEPAVAPHIDKKSSLFGTKVSGNASGEPSVIPASTPSRASVASGEPVFVRETTPTVGEPASRSGVDGIYTGEGKLNFEYLFHHAEVLYRSGEFALARNIYKTVLQSGDRTALSLYWIGRCLEAEGKLPEAIAHYEESITYHPSFETFQNMAALLVRCRKDEQAAQVMERTLALRELSPAHRMELHTSCGNSWMRADKPLQAERHYRKALEINPSADHIQANLGALYLQQNKTAEAKRCFQDAISSNPKNDKALSGMGSCCMAEGEKRQAHDYFLKSLNIHLNNATAVFYLVKCAYEIKSYAAAARVVEEYIQIAPVNANLLYSLAGLQYHLGRLDEARETAQKILRLQPGHSGAAELVKMTDR